MNFKKICLLFLFFSFNIYSIDMDNKTQEQHLKSYIKFGIGRLNNYLSIGGGLFLPLTEKFIIGTRVNVNSEIDMFKVPNEGLLFFVQNYNPINAPPNEYILGYTTNRYSNGNRIEAPISFVFVQRIRDIVDSEWEDEELSTTTIHELGHLWCANITDRETHTRWHNGNNQHFCALNYFDYNSAGIPQGYGDEILRLRRFCEGHLQRGMNVSWYERHYNPFGEVPDPNQPNQALFASITNENMNNGDSIEIKLRLSKSEFYQGESINALISINNYLNDTISIGQDFDEYLLESATNKINFGGEYYSHRLPIRIPPFGNYKSIVEVQGVFGSQADKLLPPGTYEYWISHRVLKSRKIFSNKVRFTILEPPDSLKTQLDELLYNPQKYRTFEEAKVLYERYKDSFYGEMALRKLLGYPSMEPTLRIELSKRFIVNYPNTASAYDKFIKLTYQYDENKNVIEDIIKELKMKQPDCFLFELLKNGPDYIETYRKIKQLIIER